MKTQERFDKILAAVRTRMQDELSALLGGTVVFSAPFNQLVGKADYFAQASGNRVLARLDVSGELVGEAYLLVSLQDALRLGGTLIMLPPDGLEAALAAGEYGGETRDAFGEIANIVAGVLTSVFEEQYSAPVRFVRTEQEVVSPPTVDPAADIPFPPQSYYQMSSTMGLGDRQLGDLHLLFPALTFGLIEEEASPEAPPAAETGAGWSDAAAAVPPAAESTTPAAPVPPVAVDQQKQRKLVERLIHACREKSAEEVAALMGVKFALTSLRSDLLSKEATLDLLDGKQIMARMTLRGEVSGEGYWLAAVKDGVRLGGTLIMLPPDELEQAVGEDRFEGEIEDAYGEITNIVAGAFTGVFEEMYPKQFGFVREGLEQILPFKIDPDTDDTLPHQLYFVAVFGMTLEGKELGHMHVCLPAGVLDLRLEEEVLSPSAQSAAKGKKQTGPGAAAAEAPERARPLQALEGDGPELLVVSEAEGEGQAISAMLQQRGFAVRLLHWRDSFNDYLPGEVQGVFLVMREVSEQGFGVVIKLRGACVRIPLILCGPAWTRSKVLQAVRYGADDILITPAGADDVDEQLARHITPRKAA